MLRAGVAAVLMLVTPGVLHAQSRPPQVRGSGGLGIFAEAEEHSLATVGWRKYVGARGWGFEIEGLAMRGDDHHEAAFAVDLVKDLAPPDSLGGHPNPANMSSWSYWPDLGVHRGPPRRSTCSLRTTRAAPTTRPQRTTPATKATRATSEKLGAVRRARCRS